MSAIVCGKRPFFEDMDAAASSPASASPPAYKKLRCSSSTSPVRFTYSPPAQTDPVDQLKALFPELETQLLERVLEKSGNDVNLAIKSLTEICLQYSKGNSGITAEENALMGKVATLTDGDTIPLEEPQTQKLPVNGAEWVDLFVREMSNATCIDDARSRVASILESLEKTIRSQAGAEVAQSFEKENLMLKEHVEGLHRDNAVLKRAVAIQHERQKENDEKNQEVQQLKQLLGQYQEQMRSLEAHNYALTLRLHQTQMSNSIPGRFNPDVF